jgi:hypothetical protein
MKENDFIFVVSGTLLRFNTSDVIKCNDIKILKHYLCLQNEHIYKLDIDYLDKTKKNILSDKFTIYYRLQILLLNQIESKLTYLINPESSTFGASRKDLIKRQKDKILSYKNKITKLEKSIENLKNENEILYCKIKENKRIDLIVKNLIP